VTYHGLNGHEDNLVKLKPRTKTSLPDIPFNREIVIFALLDLKRTLIVVAGHFCCCMSASSLQKHLKILVPCFSLPETGENRGKKSRRMSRRDLLLTPKM